jgi:hypothetical protein
VRQSDRLGTANLRAHNIDARSDSGKSWSPEAHAKRNHFPTSPLGGQSSEVTFPNVNHPTPNVNCARILSPINRSVTMGSLSPASTETSDSEECEFGYPLQRMVPLENIRFGGEESPLLPGLYRMSTSQSSSTSSHMFYVYVVALFAVPCPIQNARLLPAISRRSSTSISPNTKTQIRRTWYVINPHVYVTSLAPTTRAGYRRSRHGKVHSSSPPARKTTQHGTPPPPRAQRRRYPCRPMEPRASPTLHRTARDRRRGPMPRASLRLFRSAFPDSRERSRLHPPVARSASLPPRTSLKLKPLHPGPVLPPRAQNRTLRLWRA